MENQIQIMIQKRKNKIFVYIIMETKTDDKKELLRKKSLQHYYENIPYYREYYVRNKEKLLKYNKDYKTKCKNITFERNFKKVDIEIKRGNFIIDWD